MSTDPSSSVSRKRPPPVETAAAEVAAQGIVQTTGSLAGGVARPSTPETSSVPSSKRLAGEASASSRDVGSKPYKGLRYYSKMVCKKVEEKGTTSYNEVADELVDTVKKEFLKENPHGKFDEKNVRRRIYDVVNVFMAMDIISKDKKAIVWKGLPSSAHQDIEMLTRERDFRMQEIHRKREALQHLLTQQVCFRNLVQHNHARGLANDPNDHKIPLPFIVVNTHSSAVIQCNMSRELTDVMFDFSAPFEINDDNMILNQLGMYVANTSNDVGLLGVCIGKS
jgi:hypothetical protein